jgi:hypothetical protein
MSRPFEKMSSSTFPQGQKSLKPTAIQFNSHDSLPLVLRTKNITGDASTLTNISKVSAPSSSIFQNAAASTSIADPLNIFNTNMATSSALSVASSLPQDKDFPNIFGNIGIEGQERHFALPPPALSPPSTVMPSLFGKPPAAPRSVAIPTSFGDTKFSFAEPPGAPPGQPILIWTKIGISTTHSQRILKSRAPDISIFSTIHSQAFLVWRNLGTSGWTGGNTQYMFPT